MSEFEFKGVWKAYYSQLAEIYKFLNDCTCLFSLNDPFNALDQPSGKYRGVFKINQSQIDKLKTMLEDGERLYDVASIDSKRKALPINFPRFLEDESIFKMQIHINKAHLSKNFNPQEHEMIRVATVPTLILETDDKEQMKADIKAFYQAEADLEKLGYQVLIEQLPSHDVMYIDVKTLCKLNKCESVQHRIDTGRQIRANYFSHDDRGFITKSKLQSIGILLVPQMQPLDVVQSHDRKIREDAIYTERHPTEIILKQIPAKLVYGRFYRR